MKWVLIISVILLLPPEKSAAQICNNSTDSVYGLTAVATASPAIAMGQIVGINLNNAGTVAIGSPSAAANAANAIGFSQVNGRFYYFNQVGSGTIEFISYDPQAGTKHILANPPLLPTNQRIRAGTVNKDGTGYYMIYPAASTAQGYPKTGPALYFYNIPLNTWTLITQDLKNSSGTNIANIITLNSGDMAFDGSDNLWLLCSNTSNHALYKIDAPVPTTAVASVLVDTIIAQRANPVAGVSFTGICFNFPGDMYLTTGSGVGAGNNKLYRLATITSPFTLVGTVPNSYGDDLTSCVFPVGVLSVNWLNYQATINGNRVQHKWSVNKDPGKLYNYTIQYSVDARYWNDLSAELFPVDRQQTADYFTAISGFPDAEWVYFRIRAVDVNGDQKMSPVRRLAHSVPVSRVSLFPNPATSTVVIRQVGSTGQGFFRLMTVSGKTVLEGVFQSSGTEINISTLAPGVYLVMVTDQYGHVAPPAKLVKSP
jgi:Secretion system C-terminal sorting domain